jgi:hypothetical protein
MLALDRCRGPLAALAALVLAALCLARPTLAQDARCAESVLAWVKDLERGAGVPTEATACWAGSARIRLSPEGALPLDVIVAEPPGPAFQRAGRLRVSPVLEVSDWKTVPQARREAFDRALAWLAAHEADVTFESAPALRAVRETLLPAAAAPMRLPWLAAVAVALVIAARTRAPSIERRDVVAAACLTIAALALRLGLGAFGPFHINGQGPLWVSGAASSPDEIARYGPGYAEMFGALARAFPSAPDTAIFAANAAFSAVAPALALAIGRLAGVDRARAGFAAAALALDPVAVRFAATEAYFPVIIALTLGAAAAAAAAAGHAARGDRIRAALFFVASGLLCAQAARTHPAAWIPTAIAPFAAGAARLPGATARRLAITIAAVGTAALVILVTSGAEILPVLDQELSREDAHLPPLHADDLQLPVIAALVAFVALRWQWLFAPALLAAFAGGLTHDIYGQSALWQQSYDRLFLGPILLGLAAALPASASRRKPAAAVALAAWIAIALPSAPRTLFARSTEHLEERWLRAFLARLPPSCRVAHVAAAGRRVLFLPTYAAPPHPPAAFIRLDGRRPPLHAAAALDPLGCAYYVRTSLCSSDEGRASCAEAEADLELEPILRATFPAAATYDAIGYDTPHIETSISRVKALRLPPPGR